MKKQKGEYGTIQRAKAVIAKRSSFYKQPG